jgi:hypothetical protein
VTDESPDAGQEASGVDDTLADDVRGLQRVHMTRQEDETPRRSWNLVGLATPRRHSRLVSTREVGASASNESTDAGQMTSGTGDALADDVAYLQSEISRAYPQERRRSRYRLWIFYRDIPPEATVALATAAAIFSKAFLETLGSRAGDSIANLPKHVRDLVRKNRHDRGTREIHVSGEGEATAIVVVTAKLPDEARLALLDLDVTAEELRGKMLRWNSAQSAWLPDEIPPAEPGAVALFAPQAGLPDS